MLGECVVEGKFRPRVCENSLVGMISLSMRADVPMTDFIQGENRYQSTLFPERLDEYIAEDSAVRVIDVFIDETRPLRSGLSS